MSGPGWPFPLLLSIGALEAREGVVELPSDTTGGRWPYCFMLDKVEIKLQIGGHVVWVGRPEGSEKG